MAKILVADDEPELRNAVDVMLSSKGHTVIHAEDGVQALESIRKHSPDVIVCDIEMPKLRGFEVLMQLREHPTMAKIPVIFLTGMTDISYMIEAMQLNVNDFLTKPFTDEELFGAVDLQLKKLDGDKR
jgi:CheY-like chemotaxis protein